MRFGKEIKYQVTQGNMKLNFWTISPKIVFFRRWHTIFRLLQIRQANHYEINSSNACLIRMVPHLLGLLCLDGMSLSLKMERWDSWQIGFSWRYMLYTFRPRKMNSLSQRPARIAFKIGCAGDVWGFCCCFFLALVDFCSAFSFCCPFFVHYDCSGQNK